MNSSVKESVHVMRYRMSSRSTLSHGGKLYIGVGRLQPSIPSSLHQPLAKDATDLPYGQQALVTIQNTVPMEQDPNEFVLLH